MAKDPSPAKSRKSRWLRRLAVLTALSPALVLVLWVLVHKVEWLGPWIADSLRSVVGTEAVTELENWAYGVQDRVYRYWRKDEKPQPRWEVPESPPAAAEPAKPTDPEAEAAVELTPFRPEDVGAVHKSWSAPGDGQWVAMENRDKPAQKPHMFKTLLHPDKRRSWAELFVVAIDLRRVTINLVPGSREPRATEEEALEIERPGKIPSQHHDEVLAAFNGGFKTEHGRYGMAVGNLTIVKPREKVCTLARYKDNTMIVSSWEKISDSVSDMVWWRQTPNCMYEDNKMHPRLQEGYVKKWGATLDGETVIRRSAIGINQQGDILFVGISNHTTAPAIALGMNHAGAVAVAQLDVNFSYPKFVTFEKNADGSKRIAIALADGFEYSDDEYLRKASYRDFFYVMPRGDSHATAQK